MNLSSQLRRTRPFARVLATLALLLVALAGYAPRALAAGPAPFALEFDGSDNSTILNTFLTTVLPGTNAPNGGATVNTATPGTLTIQTTSGELAPGATTQDNALAIPYTSSGAYTVQARLIGPLPFTGPYQSGGIYIGQNQRSYIRFTAGFGSKRSSGERLQLDVMDRGKLRSSVVPLPAGSLVSAHQSLDLFLTFDHNTNRVSALYCINCTDSSTARLASTRAFPHWLRQGNTVSVFGGVMTTNRGTPQSIPVVFDWFRLTAPVTAVVTGSKTVDKDGLSGPPVNPGDTLTYTISVTNNGAAGTSIQVADPIPVDTTFLSLTPPAAGAAQLDGANNRMLWQIASLGGGQTATFSFQVKINQAPLQSAAILNTAAMTSGGSGSPALLSAATVVGVTPDLSDSIYTAIPATVGPNGTVTYALNLLNDGTAIANSATAQLSIPSGTTYVQGSAQASSGALNLDPLLTTINWTAASPLAINGTAAITFTVRAGSGFANGAPIISQAIVQAGGVLPSIESAQAIFSVPSSVTGIKTVDKSEANPGDTLTYTIKISNNSGTAVNSLQVVDPIPQDTAYITGTLTSPAVGTASYDGANKRVTWQIPSLGASQTVTISLKVAINSLPLQSSVILNRAVLTDPSASVSQTLLIATTVVRGVADLSDSIYTASPATVGANGTIVYTLNLLNDGTTAAANTTAHLTIPNIAGVTFVTNSAQATSGVISQSAAQLNWIAGGALPIGAVVRISFQMRISGTPTNGTLISSTATMQANGTLPTVETAKAIYSSAVQSPHYQIYIPAVYR
jgi:uncharacterized repeat protein (TIGR01451 family)